MSDLQALLSSAIDPRTAIFDDRHETAFRLFNGFYEGEPSLAVDVYARTLLLHNYADPPAAGSPNLEIALSYLLKRMPWIQAAVVKHRFSGDPQERRGVIVHGSIPDRSIREAGVRYAIDLPINRDASFYLDTRLLRHWAKDKLAGRSVFNAFAYTGSLGVAARAGGAAHVMHVDRSRQFLNLAKASYTLNGFSIEKGDFVVGDFWAVTSQMRREGRVFDCVFLDPPFFAATGGGTVDLLNESARLINKVRPLVASDGWLVAVNNALFLPGQAYIDSLQALCADGYLSIETLIPVPEDFTGYPSTRVGAPPADTAPFNHPTKIAVLRVRRKSASPSQGSTV